jgi:hypothetical protein
MTVGELRKALEGVADDMKVVVSPNKMFSLALDNISASVADCYMDSKREDAHIWSRPAETTVLTLKCMVLNARSCRSN